MNAQGNIYAHARDGVLAAQADRISGGETGLAMVIFTEPLTEVAENALEKSFSAIGFAPEACTYAQVEGLSPEEVFDMVEGIDPLVLVATDEMAAMLYSKAVRQDFPPLRRQRVFGREARAFPHINDMMQAEADKQTVWHLLKSLA